MQQQINVWAIGVQQQRTPDVTVPEEDRSAWIDQTVLRTAMELVMLGYTSRDETH